MVYSVYIMPGAEALASQKILAALLRYKLNNEYPKMCSFVRAIMSLAIVRSNSLLYLGPWEKAARVW